ncbi:MAG: oxidoreductase [Gammaproteobacteria bacterium SG8_31]|jgi:dihydroorotate dehydrogenase electron transfer subunit|nr:MAG: oxidoreductase [Gammaproteobacteria bacterium SG8_31]
MKDQAHRGTIFVEDGEVVEQVAYPADQFIIRIRAPRCAETARPGSFAHITCDPELPMRRPLSIMGADPATGTVDFLYKIVGHGLALLAQREPGDSVSVLGPIGQPFRPDPTRPRALLIGGGVGIPPMVFLAERLAADPDTPWQPLVLMGSEVPFPFELADAGQHCHLPAGATGALAALQAAGVPSRLASVAGLAGCFDGFVTDLAEAWLSGLGEKELAESALFACGPTPMLAATAKVAERFGLPCQVSLEEYMACAVGGCAGCTVPVRTPDGVAMKRVCVDGPVFDAAAVFPVPDWANVSRS